MKFWGGPQPDRTGYTYKKGKFKHRDQHAWREDNVRTQGEQMSSPS